MKGNSVKVVAIDPLSKYCHLGAFLSSYMTSTVANFFVANIIKLHTVLKTMVSDQDKAFISRFWKDLFCQCGTTLQLTSSYHPKSEGQTKIVNKMIKQFLRATVQNNP